MNYVTSKMKYFSKIVAQSSNLNVAELLFLTLHCTRFVLQASKGSRLALAQREVMHTYIRIGAVFGGTIKTPAVEPNFVKVTALRQTQTLPRHLSKLGNCEYFTTSKNCFLNKRNISYAISYGRIKGLGVLSTYVCF